MPILTPSEINYPKLWGLREPVNAITHLIGAFLVLPLGWLTISNIPDGAHFLVYFTIILYIISVFSMFLSSGLYHALPLSGPRIITLRRIDHVMIYFVIAGSYTPFCLLVLDGWLAWGMLIVVWSLAIAGIVKKFFWFGSPSWLSLALYLGMGWMAVFSMPAMHRVLPWEAMMWVYAGGLFYTVGAVIYGAKKPNPLPGVFGHHEIWHLFVLGGAFSHYYAIHRFVSVLPFSLI